MVYFAWIMRGATPPVVFNYPFVYQYRQLFTTTESLPESPLYSPRLGFFTIIRNKRCTPQIYDLLCDMRDLTCRFIDVDLLGPRETAESFQSTPEAIYARVLNLASAAIPGTIVSGDWVYESCRLAAHIYCSQLCPPSADDIVHTSSLISVIHDLQSTLARSDVSECWGDMAGVLFWCALIGSNCMRDALKLLNLSVLSDQDQPQDLSLQKHEYCRKWLTLLAVRIGVVLGFQYPEAICVTLRRYIHVRSAALRAYNSLG
jgi:hypothetical protein